MKNKDMKLIMENFRKFKKKVLNEMVPDQTLAPVPGVPSSAPPRDPSMVTTSDGKVLAVDWAEDVIPSRVEEYLSIGDYCLEKDDMGMLTNCHIDMSGSEGGSGWSVFCKNCKGVQGLEVEVTDDWVPYITGKVDVRPPAEAVRPMDPGSYERGGRDGAPPT